MWNNCSKMWTTRPTVLCWVLCCEAEVESFERLLTVTHIHVTGWMDGRMLGSEADPAISERRCSTFPIDPPIFLPSSPTRVPFPFIPSFTKPPSQIEIYSLGEHCKLHQCVWHRARPQKQFWHFWSPGGKNLGSSCVVNLFQNIPLSTLYRLGFGKPGHVSTSESACEGFTAVWAQAQRNTSNNTTTALLTEIKQATENTAINYALKRSSSILINKHVRLVTHVS